MKIAIIGQGRFGKLLGKILAPYGEIFVMEKDLKKIEKKQVLIKKEDLKEIDWVFLAVPISNLEKLLLEIRPHLKKGSLVVDVSSVKIFPCRWLKKYLPRNVEIMGTHPMFGPDSAKNGLPGLKIVLCPVRISLKNKKKFEKIMRSLKLKIIFTTPQKHDAEIAKSLTLVHFIGRTLGRINIKKQEITTLGFERLLAVNETVNSDTWQLFLDMHRYNPYAKNMRHRFLKSAREIDSELKKQ